MAKNRAKVSGKITRLEEGSIRRDVLVADDLTEKRERTDGAQQRAVIVLGERNALPTFARLDGFSLVKSDANSRDAVEILVGHVPPAHQPGGVHGVVGGGQEA